MVTAFDYIRLMSHNCKSLIGSKYGYGDTKSYFGVFLDTYTGKYWLEAKLYGVWTGEKIYFGDFDTTIVKMQIFNSQIYSGKKNIRDIMRELKK